MKTLNEVIATLIDREIKLTDDKINQSDRNAIRAMLMDALCVDLGGTMTSDGIIIEIPHDELGCLMAEVTIKMKSLDYDIESAATEYQEKLTAKAEKEKAKAEKTAKANSQRKADNAKNAK